MLLIEKRVELNKNLYIDSWFDRYSKSYITQVKDLEDNEIDYAYSGDSKGRDADILAFKEKYKGEIVEYLQPKDNLEEKKKKKQQELPMTGLNPIMPDAAKGIDTFNSNMDSGDMGSTGSGE